MLPKPIFTTFRALSNRSWLSLSTKTPFVGPTNYRYKSETAFDTSQGKNIVIEFKEELDENAKNAARHIQNIKYGTIPDSNNFVHPKMAECVQKKFEGYNLPHRIWTEEELYNIEQTHIKPRHLVDWCSYLTVQTLRLTWDITTGYFFSKKLGITSFSYRQWLLRVVFLETVAGVPGMMFAMVRHLRSLRKMQRDYGWIHTLLEEAENERMHLLIALKAYNPGLLVRSGVISAQAIMCLYLACAYFINPTYCHRLVGYLEEQAVKTYTVLINDTNEGKYPMFEEQAHKIARNYYRLPENGTWKDVFLQIRADEAHHRDVNHTLAPLAKERYAPNPIRINDS